MTEDMPEIEMMECEHQYRRNVACPYCDLNESEAEVCRLRAALRKYGWHRDECRCMRHQSPRYCSCGFDAALADEKSGG